MSGQLSTASAIPSASASSSVAEQAPLWRTTVWQTPPPEQSRLLVQASRGALLHTVGSVPGGLGGDGK